MAKALQGWWLGYSGDVIVSAASPGQLAQGGFECEEGEMDYFTGTLCMLMDNYSTMPGKFTVTWQKFLSDLSYWTNYHVRIEQNEEQTPYFKTNLNKLN